jgi:hypothetical protein
VTSDSKTKTALKALKAAGHDQAAAIAEAILGSGENEAPAAAPAPSAGEPDPAGGPPAPLDLPAGLLQAAAAAGPGEPTDLEKYSAMSGKELAALPEDEYKRVLKLLTKGA